MVPGLIWPGEPLTTGAPAQMLTPAADMVNGALDLTSLLAAPSSTTLRFTNTCREHLLVQASAPGITVQVDVGSLVLGQPVANFTPVTLTSGHLYQFGEFRTVIDLNGTNLVSVTLSSTSNVLVALVQDTGDY
jgi:hypothetical protein